MRGYSHQLHKRGAIILEMGRHKVSMKLVVDINMILKHMHKNSRSQKYAMTV